ncbi:hypothetical protein LOTGIDRAFT_222342 [Lottia gigantea]|uniref:Peptidase M16C associated domain-containing protein n=1 Tax=Lottia gigantea TaxID=225164 RepID=V3Z0C7_LOTGI|nr:hypothetical protein LOTGIDRAFT_222342 [Lottia gigantea]ESO83908.1 hypothetical protein LOTGIDRAFT_222342 [Lottia gigantea]
MANHNFELLHSVKANNSIPVSKYKSKDTGLTVFLAQVEGPLVNGYFCLATEAHDDDGLPHTLEHLIFLGSEKYPYKGILDLLANRCLASGTNAWTDTDHTCYTMTNAGSEGFNNLLPIYIDHILYPTLKESGYVTEVHHVNGEGEDAGVVYCEMQARENSGESRCHLAMLRNMYPGICGFKSETGGIMANLRDSTSHVKVMNYHKEFYRPENLCLVITGQVTPEDVFAALQPVENSIKSKGPLTEFKRPWQSSVPSLDKTVETIVPFPSDDEDRGMVYVGWRGPLAKDQYTMQAIAVLLQYLSLSAISPLEKTFIEIEQPYCSKVGHSIIENTESCIYLTFQNCLTQKSKDIYPKLQEVLSRISKKKDSFDMKRMQTLIHRNVLDAMNNVEDQPHDTIAFQIIGDFLYGHTEDDLKTRLNTIDGFKQLKLESEDYWINLIGKYFVDKPCVVIIGEPSIKLMEEMGQTEKDRVAKQRSELRESGLKKMAETLEKATEENEIEPTTAMLTCVDVPKVASIKFHPISPSSNHNNTTANKTTKFPLYDIPFRFQLDDIHTNFVEMTALIDSSGVPQEYKLYLPLFSEALMEIPIKRNGVLISHEDVISQLESDTLSAESSWGFQGSTFSCGSFPQLLNITLKVEIDKYEAGVKWLQDFLYNTVFTEDRLKIVAKRLVNSIASYKRKGNAVARMILNDLLFQKECNHHIVSAVRQETFLTSIGKLLESNPKKVVEDVENLRKILTNPMNLRVHVAADVKNLTKDLSLPWRQFLPVYGAGPTETGMMKKTYEYILPYTEVKEKSILAGIGSIESAYLYIAVPCINDFNHPDLPSIQVLIQYLTQLEGPMWKQIRGLGLSYSYTMYLSPESGLLCFYLGRSTHIVNAYKEGRDIVLGYINGDIKYNTVELEAARSSLIFEIIELEKNVSDVSHQSLLSYLKQIDHDYNKKLLEKVSKVTIEDLKRVGPIYFPQLFDVNKIRCVVCVNPSKIEEINKDFKELSLNTTVMASIEEGFLAEV